MQRNMKIEEVVVDSGRVLGTPCDSKNVTVFKGIPYAAPPIGELRWRTPQPVKPWSGVRVCNHFSPICPQDKVSDGVYKKEFYSEEMPEASEDCLYLNVWAPTSLKEEKLPVIVYIHGGAFTSGWSFNKEIDGAAYAERGIVFVTINYRLNIFGFLAHTELSVESENGFSGNYGLLDQLTALKWVHENIVAFGGDPDNVTLFGSSAGACSIYDLVCSPLSEGLIHKAILSSGDGIGGSSHDLELTDMEKIGEEICGAFGVNSIELLRRIPAEKLLERMATFWPVSVAVSQTFHYLTPNVDGYILKATSSECLTQGEYLDIPYLVGYVENEIVDAISWARATEMFAANNAKLGRPPAYVYNFMCNLPGDESGAFHASELWYVFGTLARCWRPFTDKDNELSERILNYFSNFAKSGNPNGDGLPLWVPYTQDAPEIKELDI